MISNGFIINPYHELLPDYKICPFSNKDLFINRSLPDNDFIDDYFSNRFYKKKYTYTLNGREAISLALKHYNLNPDDVVTIFTTSNNFYISSCVTREIEKFCKWSRIIEQNTKVLFVNHEFGYPYEQLNQLKKYNLPIIEDCAHSFFSVDRDGTIGTIGDFVIYSFPKMFPMQVGGLMVSKITLDEDKIPSINPRIRQYIQNVLAHYLRKKAEIINARIRNYKLLKQEFLQLGFFERFHLVQGIVPGVFMFKTGNRNINLLELKKHFYAHGIQCSVFYGENSFFIPCHQNLYETDLEYFVTVIKTFKKK